MARKRKAGDVGKIANKNIHRRRLKCGKKEKDRKGKAPASEKSIGEEKEHYETTQAVLESKDVENNMPEHVSHIEHIVESENLVEKGKEEPNSCQQFGTVPSLDERNTKQKVCRTTNADPSSELGYKSMYITSQKQVEYLMAENCRLSMKLEFFRGKIEAYEKVNDAICATKDVILVDSIRGKTQENAIGNADSAPDADNHVASPEKNDSKNASNIANEQKKVSRQRKKNC